MRTNPPLRPHLTPAHRCAALILLTILAACSTAPQSTPDLSRATNDSATGHWDDLSAALATAQRLHGLAVLTDTTPEPGVRLITHLTNLDHRVTIRAQSTGHTDPRTDATFDFDVTYGLWGDQEKERAIIQTLQQRLRVLAQRPD